MQLMISGIEHGAVHLRNLRFAFPISIRVENGICGLSLGGYTRSIYATETRLIAPLEMITLTIEKRSRIVIAAIDIGEEGPSILGRVDSNPRSRIHTRPNATYWPIRRRLAQVVATAVFDAPHLNWRLSSAPIYLTTNETNISRTLMQEGESFREIVRTQRLMRLLFDTYHYGQRWLASCAYGFPERCRLENAAYDHFGITPELLSRVLCPMLGSSRDDRYARLAGAFSAASGRSRPPDVSPTN